jgi:hypothetical protein
MIIISRALAVSLLSGAFPLPADGAFALAKELKLPLICSDASIKATYVALRYRVSIRYAPPASM